MESSLRPTSRRKLGTHRRGRRPRAKIGGVCLLSIALLGAAHAQTTSAATKKATTTKATKKSTAKTTTPKGSAATAGTRSRFKAEVWADNWFSMAANGTVVGEDSEPITAERSFNSTTFTFAATYPLTVAIEAKDFKQDDTGLEYIGTAKQQMGDGGLIAQITDLSSGKVIAATDATWKTMVIHRAPLNPTCAKDSQPENTCRFSSIAAPADWTTTGFDDTKWKSATVWTSADVGPKGGYTNITWNSAARLVWGTDLHVDNTALLRLTVG